MRRAVDLLKLADRHVRLDLRRLQVGVAEHRLDEADIGAAFQHQRRHGVAEGQWGRREHIRPIPGRARGPVCERNFLATSDCRS